MTIVWLRFFNILIKLTQLNEFHRKTSMFYKNKNT